MHNGDDRHSRALLEDTEQEDLQVRGIVELEDIEQQEDYCQDDDGDSIDCSDGTVTPAVNTPSMARISQSSGINANRGQDSGAEVKSPHEQHFRPQGRMHHAQYGHNGHAHHARAIRDNGNIQERQLLTIVLSNNEYSTSTTATVKRGRGDDDSPPTIPTANSGRDTSIHVRGNDGKGGGGSPPSSPIEGSQAPLPPIVSTITLSNFSPILTTLSPTPTTSTTSRRTRKNPKITRTPTSTSTTTRRRRPTPTRTSTSSTRRGRPTPKPKPTPTPTRTSTRRTRTKSSTRSSTTSDATKLAPPISPSPPPPRISNIVHICIARLPITEQGGPPPPLVTFTSTGNIPGPTRRPRTPTRPTPGSRDGDGSDNSDDARNGGEDGAGGAGDPVLTVTNYNCQLTPPQLSSLLSDASASLETLSPSNGLNVDVSTIPNLGPAAADPTTGNDGDGDGFNGDEVAFFATPGGKGTIAGISIASAVLLLSFVLFFVWRKKRNDEDGNGGGMRRGLSASSFGDSSNEHFQPPLSSDPLESPPAMLAVGSQRGPQMQEVAGGAAGTFFVTRRSRPPSMRGNSTPPRINTNNQIDAITAARAISPLAMLQRRPEAFFASAPLAARRPSGSGNRSKEGYNSGSEEQTRPNAGSSQTHDPFRDPSSTGHGHGQGYGSSSNMSHDPHVAAAFPGGDKHERRRSGYTSDTYRKRRSRPLSVRNPDSDEAQQGIENLYVDRTPRTPRSASSDAVYNVDNAQVPDSANLEYYLGSNAATPRGNTPVQGFVMSGAPTLPPPPQNTYADQMPETPRTVHQAPWAAYQHPIPEQDYAMPYGGMEEDQPNVHPSRSSPPEFEPQMEYTYPKPRAIAATAAGSPFSRPHLHSSPAAVMHQDAFNQPLAAASPPQMPLQATTAPSNLSRAVEQHSRAPGASTSRQTRRSTISSDGGSSHSSMWRAWEHNNRSWVNEGFETPSDVQDVQLGSNAGAVGGGNSTSIAGYFSWR